MSYVYPEYFSNLRRDRLFGFIAAFALHLALFGAGAYSFSEPVSYGVETGVGSIEVNLIAAPLAQTEEIAALVSPAEIEDEAVSIVDEPPAQLPKAVPASAQGDGSSPVPGKDATTLFASGGALGESAPDYLKNPAPRYPEAARRKGQEGTVLISVRVSKRGFADEASVKTGSGFPLLDDAALRAVRKWKFKQALFAGFPVESMVEVPVRFDLEE